MKKIAVLFAVLLLLFPSACAETATEKALAVYTDEDLQNLIAVCKAELLRRSGEGFDLEPGLYICGVDFPSGAYRIDMKSGFASMADFYVYANEEMYIQQSPYINIMLSLVGGQPSIGRVYLPELAVLYITGSMRFSLYTGVNP